MGIVTDDALVVETKHVGGVLPSRYNGTTWDREHNNRELTVLASAARTATVSSADFTNYNARGAIVIIDVTATALTPSITVDIEGKDPESGKYWTLLVSGAITTVSTNILEVGPGTAAAANLVAQKQLPRTWRVTVTHADTDSITYSIGAIEIV